MADPKEIAEQEGEEGTLGQNPAKEGDDMNKPSLSQQPEDGDEGDSDYVVAPEVARQEVDEWLEMKRISKRKLETLEPQKEEIINQIVDGYMYFESNGDDKTLCQILRFPFKKESGGTIDELRYKTRVTRSELNSKKKGIKNDDIDQSMAAWGAALTGQPRGIINQLDSEDSRVVDQVVTFFS